MRPLRILGAAVLGVLSVPLLGGCDTRSWFDPSELAGARRAPARQPLTVPILNQLDPSIEEPDDKFVNAQPPTEADLQTSVTDYVISPNDLLSVTVSDLQGAGVDTVKTTRVSETGNISLPFLGQIRAEGMTEAQLEQVIVEAYGPNGINLIRSAQVSVQVAEARGRAFSITGAVNRPGQYAILDTDFRLMDALVLAGGEQSPLQEVVYIIRDLNDERRPATAPATAPATPPANGDDLMPPDEMTPPDAGGGAAPGEPGTPGTPGGTDDVAPGPQGRARPGNRPTASPVYLQAGQDDTAPDAAGQPGGTGAAPARQPGTTAPSDRDPSRRIITIDGRDTVAPEPGADAGTEPGTDAVAPPADDGIQPGTGPGTAPDAGAATGTDTTAAGGGATTRPTTGAEGAAPPAPPGSGFAFNGPGRTQNIRVIRVPLDRLRNGELEQFNVAIHPKDTIVVPYLTIGEYYMGGHVARPGAYSLTGRKITLKQAIIAASMLDGLAIPQRTDVIRRLGPDREVFVRVDLDKVFAGQQPDIYLKPNDQVLVGTNAIAPFLAAFRGAFRLTYGFGFLYDRNFNDEDFNDNN